ncbi:MAG: hypothetical protein ACYC35_15805, partial [Pirellulales bacterium]
YIWSPYSVLLSVMALAATGDLTGLEPEARAESLAPLPSPAPLLGAKAKNLRGGRPRAKGDNS